MKFRSFVLLAVLACSAAGVCAHGDKKHVMGKVEKVSADSVVVQTKDGNSVKIKLTSSTVFMLRSGSASKPAKAGDLTVGDLVAIHATPTESGLQADEVKFSVPANPKGSTAAAPKAKR